MKKLRLIFLITLSIFAIEISAQVNQFFPVKNATWEGVTISLAGPFPDYKALCGDTIINDKTYAKLYQIQLDFDGNEVSRSYEGGTRIETDLVHWIPNDFNEEILLYDFSIEAGQTITLEHPWFSPNTLTVVSNQLINTPDGVIRRQINLQSPSGYQETWIEGIGSNLGVIYRGIDIGAVTDFLPTLHCFKFEGNLGWKNLAVNPEPLCDFTFSDNCSTTSISILNNNDISLRVFPNPFDRMTTINIDGFDQLKSPVLNIYNLQGQLIEKIPHINEEKFIFSRKNLNAGGYVFELIDWKTTFAVRKKIMIF